MRFRSIGLKELNEVAIDKMGGGPVLVQWLKLPASKVGGRGFEPYSGLQVSKKQNVSSPFTRKHVI